MRIRAYSRKWRCLFFILLGLACTQLISAREEARQRFVGHTAVLGAWWWYVELDEQNRHLDFAEQQGVTEIYYYTTFFGNNTGTFIEKARRRGMKVYLLFDDYRYIWNRRSFTRMMNRYLTYQKKAPENRKFSGLHLDIEPHQNPKFGENYQTFLQDYVDWAVWVCSDYRTAINDLAPGSTIDFDLATWHYIDVIYRGKETKLYEAIIAEADRAFVMAYRDSAAESYELAKPELDFAKSIHKQIVLGVETGRLEKDPHISYYGKGRYYFYEQLYELNGLADYVNCGLSIHHISSWYLMQP